MTLLKETFYTLAVVAVLSGLFEILSSSGRLKKYTSYTLSLIILLSLILPVSSAVKWAPSIEENYFANKKDNVLSYTPTLSSLEDATEKYISETLSIPQKYIEVKLTLSENTVISAATVAIKHSAYNRFADRIKVITEDVFGIPVNVIQDSKE